MIKIEIKKTIRFSFRPVITGLLLLTSAWSVRYWAADSKSSAGLAPIPLKLPQPGYAGTPKDLPKNTTAEKPTGKPRPAFYAPAGVKNVALGKPVISSDENPISGTLNLVTDGNKESFEENMVVLRRRTQWVQIDLERSYKIYAIVLWHEHKSPVIYRDVVVQAADDPDFITGVTTLFNNDQDNSSGLGAGTDREYLETYEGKLIPAKEIRARYVRCYSKGNTDNALNCYTEIEVYGLPGE